MPAKAGEIDVHVPKGSVPEDFCCASSGRPLFYPVVTDQGIAYCYSVLFGMFVTAEGSPKCVVTGEPITFFPNVCVALHHYMLETYKADLKGRKAIEDNIMSQYGLKVPTVADTPDEEGDEGFMEEFSCAVTGQLAYEPCCLSSGTIVSARSIPSGGFKKDPNRLVACALHGQAPKPSAVLELMIRTKFPAEYKAADSKARSAGVEFTQQPTFREFPFDAYVHWGLGCDGCGLWPIRGPAYEDVDIRSSTGFHLCEPCYELGYHKRVLGGRFSQGHMPKNTMIRVVDGFF
mmetsp:Transcript_26403/g.49644  ORF Transcript_26403/g.49644 Transcript_26403/m.49644 type:complete len:290 (+) Transcript_26403:46-915(+)